MRIALLDHARSEASARLANALRERGHEARLVSGRPVPVAEGLLVRRGFTTGLTSVPSALLELRSGGFDLAHAFTPEDALSARLWRRRGGGPFVFSPGEPLTRARLSHRRLRLALVAAAIEDSDALVATDEESRAALWRWCAVDAPLLEPGDAAGHERLYTRLLAAPARPILAPR